MHSIKRILVAVKDPARRRTSAAEKGAQLAHALGAELELFHCPDVSVFAGNEAEARKLHGAALRETRATCLRQLERLAARARKENLKVAVSTTWDYPIHEAVIRRATHIGADLIVANCHEGRRPAPALLRLIDWELIRYSPIPVLLVKNSRAYGRPAILAAVDPSQSFSKPAALDKEILRLADLLRQKTRGSLNVVHAHVTKLPLVMPALLAAPLIAEMGNEDVTEARKQLTALLRASKVTPSHRYLANATPCEAISLVARRTRAAIIVMGSIARSGLKRAFIGNTAERIINDVSCDVLVVKPKGVQRKVPRHSRGIHLVLPMPF
jgi:universal stress protein E